MINIVIPMAGLGSRFSQAGYENPKPFIDVNGKPMIEKVLENLSIPDARFILLVRDEHIRDFSVYLESLNKNYEVVIFPISTFTQGTACTVLLSRKLIDNDAHMVIANSDQIIDLKFSEFISNAVKRDLDGSILTFEDKKRDPKWSFARLDKNNFVVEVQEKKPISTKATVGIYYFKKGSDFVEAAFDMMLDQNTVNGEYYTCPVYNYLINKSLKVGIYNINEEQMHGIGTPEDLDIYLSSL
jgi:dTDP-glucose pyrophosphorylase